MTPDVSTPVRERPILFSGPMVRAILDGRKSQTRRLLTSRHNGALSDWRLLCIQGGYPDGAVRAVFECPAGADPNDDIGVRCPFGAPGDRLWVREGWRVGSPHDKRSARDVWPRPDDKGVTVLYEAGGWRDLGGRVDYGGDEPTPPWAGRRRASIHMPRWASRLTLELTGVRAEPLQDIADADVEAEGIREHPAAAAVLDSGGSLRDAWVAGWDSINDKRAPWASNPWVWVLTFRRAEDGA